MILLPSINKAHKSKLSPTTQIQQATPSALSDYKPAKIFLFLALALAEQISSFSKACYVKYSTLKLDNIALVDSKDTTAKDLYVNSHAP